MVSAEWLEWLKSVKMEQLKQSLGTRKALLMYSSIDKRELNEEIDAIKAEIASRG